MISSTKGQLSLTSGQLAGLKNTQWQTGILALQYQLANKKWDDLSMNHSLYVSAAESWACLHPSRAVQKTLLHGSRFPRQESVFSFTIPTLSIHIEEDTTPKLQCSCAAGDRQRSVKPIKGKVRESWERQIPEMRSNISCFAFVKTKVTDGGWWELNLGPFQDSQCS